MSNYFLSDLSERSEESPFLQHTGALAEILHFVQDDLDKGPRRSDLIGPIDFTVRVS